MVGSIAFGVYFLVLRTENQHNLLETIINLVCAGAMLIGIRRNKSSNRLAWYFICAGFLVFGLGNIPSLYFVWLRHVQQPFPSIADAGYLMTEPLICIGLLMLIRSRRGGRRNRNSLDAGILAIAVGFPLYGLMVAPNLAQPHVPLFSRLVSAAYPTADIMLISVAILLTLGPGQKNTAYRMLLASFVALLASDLAFSGAILAGWFNTGSFINAGWPLFSILGAAAALHPSMREIELADTTSHRISRLRIVLLAAATFSVPAVDLILELQHKDPQRLVAIVVMVVLFALSAMRLAWFVDQGKNYEKQLAHQAFHDPLTGLANRALFRDRLDHVLSRRDLGVNRFAVYFIDLDDFKTVNDGLGHTSGDKLLSDVGARLTDAVRAEDTVARLGGDEFAILAERDGAEPGWHRGLADRLLEAMSLPFELEDQLLVIRASVGVVLHDGMTHNVDELMRNADVAMYRAKAQGKSQFEVFVEGMQMRAQDRVVLVSQLQRGIDEGELEVHYQPIVRLADGNVAAMEALVRWRHPERGLLRPADFIGIAEESGLIGQLGAVVLDDACRQLARWERDPETRRLFINVNVSPRQLREHGFIADLQDAVSRHGVDPSRLVLEITETALVNAVDVVAHHLADIRALGVRIAIDDFGTGFSSLAHLRRFPVDIIKIDKSFVDGITRGPEDAAIVKAIVKMSRALNVLTVAEGVETSEQLEALSVMGCDGAQGYLFGLPASLADHPMSEVAG